MAEPGAGPHDGDALHRCSLLLRPPNRKFPQHEPATTDEQLSALEELRLPAVRLAVETAVARPLPSLSSRVDSLVRARLTSSCGSVRFLVARD